MSDSSRVSQLEAILRDHGIAVPPIDLPTVGSRLRDAMMSAQYKDLKAFHTALTERDPGACSYSALRYYINGMREPPLTVIRIAADFLGVRPAWLAFGEEPRGANS